jgi:hypothetical protein
VSSCAALRRREDENESKREGGEWRVICRARLENGTDDGNKKMEGGGNLRRINGQERRMGLELRIVLKSGWTCRGFQS